MEADATCFGLQRNHHQGAIASAKITRLVQCWYRRREDVVACTVHNTHATQAILCRHSTDVCTTSISTL